MKKLISLILILLGCATGSTSINLYRGAVTYSPTDSKRVSVYHQKPQNANFIEIGEITISEVYSWKDAEKLLKEEAAKLGGDAVYIIHQDKKSEGVIVPAYRGRVYGGGIYGSMDTTLIVTGIAIKYAE